MSVGVGLCVPNAKGESVPLALLEACGEPLQGPLCVGRGGEAVGEKDPAAVPLGYTLEGVAVRVPTPPPKLLPLGDSVKGDVLEDSAVGVEAPEGVGDPVTPEEPLKVCEKGGEKDGLGEGVERRCNEGVELPVPPPNRRGVKEEEGEEEPPPALEGEGDSVPLPVALGEGVGERLVKEEGEKEGEGVEEALPPPPPPAPAPPLWEDGEARLVREGDAVVDGEGEAVGVLFTEKLPP